ncbi:MAG TPA: ATP-binding cassette domain-containing protein [Candidatus Binatus sp.]|nr:ATP-binding cassette domain-containing protein [Candidatus Binatus sp.]
MTELISVKDLVMVYANGTKAVDGISFNVQDGEFFGFLGPNGAGKSTTIKVLTTLLHKTAGTVKVAGYDVDKQAREIRKIIGLQAQDTVIDWDLTGRENLRLTGNLHQMRGKELDDRVIELLKIVGLEDVADKRAAFYSGGMKKRLDLASVLVHRPKILFLDEPTTGLDPQSRAGIWDYLKRLNRDEKITIFLTTQYMEEADRLCARMSIVDVGKIVAQGTPSDLKGEIGADTINLTFENKNGKDMNGLKEEGRKILGRLDGVNDIIDTDNGLTVYAKNGGYLVPDIVRAFDEAQIRVASLNLSSPTLDDVFLKHTGKRIRVEELNKNLGGMWSRRRR